MEKELPKKLEEAQKLLKKAKKFRQVTEGQREQH